MNRFKPTHRPSRRFLAPDQIARRGGLRPEQAMPHGGGGDAFAEGQWQTIRVDLEREGWNPSQIELLHDQLRQGWPLPMAKQNVARISGHCPIKARTDR